MGPFVSAGTLIIHVAFDAYIVILLLRFILQRIGASWHNPVSQFVIQLTEKPLKPFRKIIPRVAGFDLSILVFAIILQYIEAILLWMLQFGPFPGVVGTLVATIGEIFSKFVYIYIYAIIINALSTWFPQTQGHPLFQTLYLIVKPVLLPIQRYVPLIAGIDLSPLVALLILTLLNLLVAQPLLSFGTKMILG